MSRNLPPRDSIAATHLWVPVDATGDDFYALGQRFGTQAGVLSEVHDETGHPYPVPEGTGFMDPRCLRWHRLQRETPQGDQDNRLAVQILNDYEAEYADVRAGDAPFGQPEFFTALNRTTREADTKGRVALPSSHRRIIDSEDDRYALALTCRSVPLGTCEIEVVPDDNDAVGPDALPPGVSFREPGTTSGTHGSVTQTAPSVSIGGVTFFGGAAVQAAQNAFAQGGSAADAARAASAAARGLPPPPLQDAGTRERNKDSDSTRPREQPPEPDDNPGGSVPLLDHPKGYVWSEAGRIGLLGTLVCPEGASGSYFAGREGTHIGPLPLRHDAQVTMGPDLVGRMVFVKNDAAEVPEGTGKLVKGWLWADTSRANIDTELGLETCQWRPVLRIDADLPPSKPPPPWIPPPWIADPPKEEEEDDEEDEDEPVKPKPKPPPTGGGSGRRPKPGEGPGESSGTTSGGGGILVGGGSFTPIPIPPRQPEGQPEGGDPPPVDNPGSQARDYEGPGEPCPNATAGVLVETPTRVMTGTTPRVGGLPVIPVPGGFIEFFGHPAVTPTAGGLLVGGEEAPRLTLGLPVTPGRRGGGVVVDPGPDGGVPRGRRVPGDAPGAIPLGLPGPRGGGVRVDPGPDDGVPRGRRVPGDDPGQLPLGIPGRQGPGLGFEPPIGGDRGVPRGYGEALERWQREQARRRNNEEYERREQEHIDDLEDLEQRAREAGRPRYADRVKRARERVERRRQKREERRQRREEYKERKRREREERRRKREERREERRRKREERRARRRREAKERRKKKPRPPQGGYMIEVTDPGAEAHSIGRLTDDEEAQLREDRRREEENRRRYEEGARFGDWNAANYPICFLGAPGGPRSLEDWSHLATYQLQAMQRIVTGAFGGPSYLAANVGVIHRNRPGNPPAGSRIGAHWTALPHEPTLEVHRGQPPLEVISVLDAPTGTQVVAHGGGVLEVVREHRGDGHVLDHRPLILLENARSNSPDTIRADMISDIQRRFYVAAGAEVTGSKLRAHYQAGETGTVFEVARTDPARGGALVDRLVYVDLADGVLVTRAGLTAQGPLRLRAGSPLLFEVQGEVPLAYSVTGTPDALHVANTNLELPVTVAIEGHLRVTGEASIAGKLTVHGSLDPTDLQLSPQRKNPIPPTAYGLWVSDGTEPGTTKGGLYYERAGKRVPIVA